MKVVFVGSVLPDDVFFNISNVSPSTNNVQLNYISILFRKYKNDLHVFSCNLNLKKIDSLNINHTISSCIFKLNNGPTIKTISFDSSRKLMNLSLIRNLKKEIGDLRNRFKKERFLFIINNHFYFHTLPVFSKKKKRDLVITILNEALDIRYIPDHGKPTLKDRVVNFVNFKLLRRNSGLISFSQSSITDYHLDSIPHIVLVHPPSAFFPPRTNVDKKSFVMFYGGLINRIYGINSILDAMSILPERFKLILCGGGDKELIESIIDKSKEDSRIKYLGLVPKKTALEYEANSNLLLMIRPLETLSDKYIARYSQPSKISEYLQSKVPILATIIEGIPLEIRPFISFVVDDDPKKIDSNVIEIEKKYSEYIEKAEAGFEYLNSHCSLTALEERFLDFIDKVSNLEK